MKFHSSLALLALGVLSACDAEPIKRMDSSTRDVGTNPQDTGTRDTGSTPRDTGPRDTGIADSGGADTAVDAATPCTNDALEPNDTLAQGLASNPIANLVYGQDGTFPNNNLRLASSTDVDWFRYTTGYQENRQGPLRIWGGQGLLRVANVSIPADSIYRIVALVKCHRGQALVECGEGSMRVTEEGLPGCASLAGSGAAGNILVQGNRDTIGGLSCFDGEPSSQTLVKEEGQLQLMVRVTAVQFGASCGSYSFVVDDG